MTPDQIRKVIEDHFPLVKVERRKTGWAFYYVSVTKGGNPTRIARAIKNGPSAESKLKLAATSRLKGEEIFAEATGASDVRSLIKLEIAVLKQNYHPSLP